MLQLGIPALATASSGFECYVGVRIGCGIENLDYPDTFVHSTSLDSPDK